MRNIDVYGQPSDKPPENPRHGPNAAIALTIAGLLLTMMFVQPAIQKELFGFVVFILAVSLGLIVFWGFLGPTIKNWWIRRKNKQRDQKATADALPEFSALVDEFFDFVDPRRGNYIANFI